MIRLLRWLLSLLTAFILLSLASYWLSLDRDFTHTRDTAALPLYDGTMGTGLFQIEANGYRFRARLAGFGPGSTHRPAVMLLHGFPSTSAMWLDLIEPLKHAGYRVVAFDQRGYSPGARPTEVEGYTGLRRIADLLAVADVLDMDQFHLVGHDFGAINGWLTVLRHPQRVLTWTPMSVPHPQAFMHALANDTEQQMRSAYIRVFQMPWIAEIALGAWNQALLDTNYRRDPKGKMAEYRKVFAEPGAMTAALDWYRALEMTIREKPLDVPLEVDVPTLFIWGNRDPAFGTQAIRDQAKYMTGPFKTLELATGHWLLNDEPETVTAAILAHLAENSE